MSRPIFLEFTCSELGIYRLEICAPSDRAADPLDRAAVATAAALCAAVNAGVADDAVFQALAAQADADAPPPEAARRRAAG